MKKENYYLDIHKKVTDDLLDIQNYIIETYYDIYAAERITKLFYKSFNDLLYFPDAFQFVNNWMLMASGVRLKRIRKYNIYYRIEENKVVILMVCSSRRLFSNIINELIQRL